MRRVKGAYTAEAACIMGILIFCIGAAVESLFYQYNKIALASLATEILWEYAWEEEEYIEEKIRDRAVKSLIQIQLEEISVEKGAFETEAVYRGRFEVPVPGIRGLLFGNEPLLISGSVSSGHFRAAEIIRMRRAWKEKGGSEDAGPLQK